MEEKDIIEQIKKDKKLPDKIKNKISNAIFECAVSSIIVYAYFIFLRLGAKHINQNTFIIELKVIQIILVIMTITLFEIAYSKKKTSVMYRGIEILLLAIITMLMQYIVLYLTPRYIMIILLVAIIYNIYYVFKALVKIRLIQKEHRSNISDIKEIVKKQPKK